MPLEQRSVFYDQDLEIEAYRLSGVVQKFPNHFHPYYVIGFMEGGRRHLWCKNQEYDLTAGDVVLFNPRDNHFCAPVNGEALDYRAINVKPEIMRRAAQEIMSTDYTPYFTRTVIYHSDMIQSLREMYNAIVQRAPKLAKEEALFFLLEQLLQEYARPFEEADVSRPDARIQKLCGYMEAHFARNITLDDLLQMSNFGKSYLLRCFTKQVGVSPYRYLQTVRVNRAKKFLEQGFAPVDAAGMAGFTDQSHFTNFFKQFIGLTPRQYQKIFTDTVRPAPPAEEWEDDKQ